MTPQRSNERVYSAFHGMTLRECFAGQMFAALAMGGIEKRIGQSIEEARRSVAREACAMADALLVALSDTAKTRVVVGPPVSLDAATVDCNGHVTTFEPTC